MWLEKGVEWQMAVMFLYVHHHHHHHHQDHHLHHHHHHEADEKGRNILHVPGKWMLFARSKWHHLKLLQYDDEYDEDFVGDVDGAGGGGDCGTMVIIQLI